LATFPAALITIAAFGGKFLFAITVIAPHHEHAAARLAAINIQLTLVAGLRSFCLGAIGDHLFRHIGNISGAVIRAAQKEHWKA
jgi:hypothetical protein